TGGSLVGYHVTNLVIHLAAALLLFGIIRRTMSMPMLRERFSGSATMLAAIVALVFVVHPLQTGSITYIVQRAESLMGALWLGRPAAVATREAAGRSAGELPPPRRSSPAGGPRRRVAAGSVARPGGGERFFRLFAARCDGGGSGVPPTRRICARLVLRVPRAE